MDARARSCSANLLASWLIPVLFLFAASSASGQKPTPTWERLGDGVLISVVPPGTFPPVNHPQFVSASEAESFMQPDEPVIGVFDGVVAKAYSLWHLDRHEVVNDRTPSLGPIAVTW